MKKRVGSQSFQNIILLYSAVLFFVSNIIHSFNDLESKFQVFYFICHFCNILEILSLCVILEPTLNGAVC